MSSFLVQFYSDSKDHAVVIGLISHLGLSFHISVCFLVLLLPGDDAFIRPHFSNDARPQKLSARIRLCVKAARQGLS